MLQYLKSDRSIVIIFDFRLILWKRIDANSSKISLGIEMYIAVLGILQLCQSFFPPDRCTRIIRATNPLRWLRLPSKLNRFSLLYRIISLKFTRPFKCRVRDRTISMSFILENRRDKKNGHPRTIHKKECLSSKLNVLFLLL